MVNSYLKRTLLWSTNTETWWCSGYKVWRAQESVHLLVDTPTHHSVIGTIICPLANKGYTKENNYVIHCPVIFFILFLPLIIGGFKQSVSYGSNVLPLYLSNSKLWLSLHLTVIPATGKSIRLRISWPSTCTKNFNSFLSDPRMGDARHASFSPWENAHWVARRDDEVKKRCKGKHKADHDR